MGCVRCRVRGGQCEVCSVWVWGVYNVGCGVCKM